MVSIAISFLVMIIAVSVSSGFRREIRSGIASVSGDIQLTPSDMNYIGEESPISSNPPGIEEVTALQGVREVQPAIYRAGIVKKDDIIHGVLFKGVSGQDSLGGLGISVPDRVASLLGIAEGDDLQAYFVGERVKVRRFNVRSVYNMPVHADDNPVILASIEDMRRLNGWEEGEVSALEVSLEDSWREAPLMQAKTGSTDEVQAETSPVWKNIVYLVGGLLGLVLGSNLFVDSASSVAYALDISEGVVGLTVVAGGTSLPELATSVVAARKGQSAIAIGNVIGSNVFNILLILGLTATISPMEIEGITTIDMAVMLISVALVWMFSFTRYTVERWEGAVLVGGYLVYLCWLISSL